MQWKNKKRKKIEQSVEQFLNSFDVHIIRIRKYPFQFRRIPGDDFKFHVQQCWITACVKVAAAVYPESTVLMLTDLNAGDRGSNPQTTSSKDLIMKGPIQLLANYLHQCSKTE